MRTKTIKLLTFDELTAEAKEIALQNIRDNPDTWIFDDWSEWIIESFKAHMATAGVNVDKVYFSGFSSQGDGASFEGTANIVDYIRYHRLGNVMRKLYNFAKAYGGDVKITQSGHYLHENTMRASQCYGRFDFESDGNYSDAEVTQLLQQADLFDSGLDLFIKTEAKKLYKRLGEEWETITGDEYIAEELINGDYEFLEDGRRENG